MAFILHRSIWYYLPRQNYESNWITDQSVSLCIMEEISLNYRKQNDLVFWVNLVELILCFSMWQWEQLIGICFWNVVLMSYSRNTSKYSFNTSKGKNLCKVKWDWVLLGTDCKFPVSIMNISFENHAWLPIFSELNGIFLSRNKQKSGGIMYCREYSMCKTII